MSSASVSGNRARSSSWQERLQDQCRIAQLPPPVFNIVSDRRGGRTAWSSTVTIPSLLSHPNAQQTLQARYWYDGQFVNNAKEDAAEVAFRTLTSASSPGGHGGSSSASSGTSSYGGMGGAMSPGVSYVGTGWGASAAGGVGSQRGSDAGWPRSPPAGSWGRVER
ncbi:hypothetical protein MMC13_008027 [Lambiella insularis]|nr:hypothetical protein [Lambiella insularis]